MSWLDEHLETFVKPVMREHDATFNLTPSDTDRAMLELRKDRSTPYFTQEEMTVIKNSWRSIKKAAKGRQILLPGRDVFIYEILARRENYPTVFMPECSRVTVKHIHKLLISKRIPKSIFVFDTGFAGSIPRNLNTENFQLLSHTERNPSHTKQVFPRLSHSRSLALKIENTPKYWETGRMSLDGEIIQNISRLEEFIKAARLTIEVYTNSSPKFIPNHKPLLHPIGGGESWYI